MIGDGGEFQIGAFAAGIEKSCGKFAVFASPADKIAVKAVDALRVFAEKTHIAAADAGEVTVFPADQQFGQQRNAAQAQPFVPGVC